MAQGIFNSAAEIAAVEMIITTTADPEDGVTIAQVGHHIDGRTERNEFHAPRGSDLCDLAAIMGILTRAEILSVTQ